jgi:nicotinamidase-related amidase
VSLAIHLAYRLSGLRSEGKKKLPKAHPNGNPMNTLPIDTTALIVIDVQKAFDIWAAKGMRRNNDGAEARIAELLAVFRRKRAPIFHIRHAGTAPNSSFRPGGPGYPVREEAQELAGEPVVVKHVNSAFIGTDLDEKLKVGGIRTVVIVGATTNHCVETTTRMAGNLGYDSKLVRDATWTFERTGPDGDKHSAESIHAMTLSNLSEEFAEIVTTADVVTRLGAR